MSSIENLKNFSWYWASGTMSLWNKRNWFPTYFLRFMSSGSLCKLRQMWVVSTLSVLNIHVIYSFSAVFVCSSGGKLHMQPKMTTWYRAPSIYKHFAYFSHILSLTILSLCSCFFHYLIIILHVLFLLLLSYFIFMFFLSILQKIKCLLWKLFKICVTV